MKKKIIAIIIAAMMVLGLSACADTRHALTVNGEEIRSGVFIYMQISAANEAVEKFMEFNPDAEIFEAGFDFFNQTIEDRSFDDWINDRTVGIIKEMAAVRLIFEDMELLISPEEELEMRRNIDGMWAASTEGMTDFATWGEFYEDIGVGKESVLFIALNNVMEERVFYGIFGEGGTEEVTPGEISEYFEQNFLRYRPIRMSTAGLDDIQVLELELMAIDFADRLNSGESFLKLQYEYEDFVWQRDNDFEDFNFDDEINDGDDEINDDDEYIPEDPFPNPNDYNDFDRLEKIGAPSQFGEEWQEFLLGMEMHVAAAFMASEDIIVLTRLPILDRQDWLDWYSYELLVEMKEDDMQGRINAKAGSLDVVLNDAAIRRYKPKRAAGTLIQPWV
jgi:hypothetical protein